MAYNEEKLTKLKALKQLAERVERDYATKTDLETKADELSGRIDEIVSTGGEPNVINEIQVNGKKVDPQGKAVNITVPTKVGDLENDSEFQTLSQVAASIKTAIADAHHASFRKVGSLPDYSDAEDNVLYLVKNDKTQCYDIYAKVDGSTKLERLDDTTVDLTAYATLEKLEQELAKKADAKHNHTTGDITDLQDTLDGKADTEHNHEISDITDLETQLAGKAATGHDHDDASGTKHGFMSAADKKKLDGIDFATTEEVESMLDEVFAAE